MNARSLSAGEGGRKQIPDCPTPVDVQPALATMFVCVMDHVAPLAERREIVPTVVRWVVVQMRAGKHDLGSKNPQLLNLRHRNTSTGPIAPHPGPGVQPAAVP